MCLVICKARNCRTERAARDQTILLINRNSDVPLAAVSHLQREFCSYLNQLPQLKRLTDQSIASVKHVLDYCEALSPKRILPSFAALFASQRMVRQ